MWKLQYNKTFQTFQYLYNKYFSKVQDENCANNFIREYIFFITKKFPLQKKNAKKRGGNYKTKDIPKCYEKKFYIK